MVKDDLNSAFFYNAQTGNFVIFIEASSKFIS